MQSTHDVVIIGGGIAGLVTGWELANAGRRPLILESGPDVGGCIARHTVGGLTLDAGAESYAVSNPSVARLITDLGLEGSVVQPNPIGAWVRHAHGTAPLPAAALLGIPSRPLAADVRRILGPWAAARAALDSLLPGQIGSAESSSLGALVGRRMGRTVVERLVEPVAGGVYSTDPDALDVDVVAPRLRTAMVETGSLAKAVRLLRGSGTRPGSAVAGLAGGMFLLVDHLERSIRSAGGTIRCGVEASGLERGQSDWAIKTSVGLVRAGTVVMAVPGQAALSLLAGIEVNAPPSTAQTSDVALVTLVVDVPELDRHPRGTGVLVSSHATGVSAKALTHATAKWQWLAEKAGPGRHVLRLSYGRGGEALPATDQLVAVALADATTLTGVGLRPEHLVDADVITWSSSLPRPEPGHRVAIDELRQQVAERPGLHLIGSMVAGTGLAAVVADARATAAELLVSTRNAG